MEEGRIRSGYDQNAMSEAGFRRLKVWQLGMELAERVYELTANFPKSEIYGLSAQMRAAAVSIPSNIAEGWGRHGQKSFASFCTIALGSLCELETQLELGVRFGYIITESGESTRSMCRVLGGSLHNLVKRLRHNEVSEDKVGYGVTNFADATLIGTLPPGTLGLPAPHHSPLTTHHSPFTIHFPPPCPYRF